MEKFLVDLIKSSKEIFLKKHRLLNHKSPNDLLTDIDLELNDYFVNAIKKEFPEAKIIAEESENDELTNELTFVIDPLDGTCNYINDLPLCGAQLAVLKDKEAILSIIYLPLKDELYVAKKGEGAFLNGKKLSLTKKDPKDSILLLSDLYKDNKEISFDEQHELIKKLKSHFLKTRLLGASSVDFTCLATGKAVAYVCFYHCIWDIAPGLLLVKELGFECSTIKGKKYEYNGESLVVANTKETLEIILKNC